MIRMNDSKAKTTLKAAVLVSAFLLFAAATGLGQNVVNLTAGPATTTLPDGTTLPMWGYSCQALAAGAVSTATCAPLSGPLSLAGQGQLGGVYVLSGGSGYSAATTATIAAPSCAINGTTCVQATATPVVSGGVVVGFNVTNHGDGYTSAPAVTITDGAGTGAAAAAAPAWSPVLITVPWVSGGASLTINLTNNLSFTAGGSANNIPTSVLIVGQVGGGLGNSHTTTPSPSHALAQGCPTWFIASPNTPPGQPCTSTTGSPASGVPPVQGPRVQSMAAEVPAGAVGTATPATLMWSSLRPGTYLIESGTHPSIQVPMGLIGMLVVTTAPSGATLGTAYPPVAPYTTNAATQTPVPGLGVQYNAEVPLEFSEIDPVQNKAVDLAVRTSGFSETAVWSAMTSPSITSLSLTSGGTGYTGPLSVSITDANPNAGGAAATAQLGGFISGITLVSGGTGYTTPQVTISDGSGTGATAEATVANGVITGIIITNPGSNYSSPVVNITDPSGTATGASATATVTGTPGVVYSVTLTNGGGAYTAPSVTITGTTGSGATVTASVLAGGCGTAHTCYPPAVNYTPFYFLINGLAFDKTNPANSVFPATAGVTGTPATLVTNGISATGSLLVRMVNAGLRMHVPAIVGSLTTGYPGSTALAVAGGQGSATGTVQGMTLIAEDGNPTPNLGSPRVQTDWFMAAGKTLDVMINTSNAITTSLPIYARDLALSANSSIRDSGMLAYISVNGAALPVANGTGVFAAAMANPDAYNSVIPCASIATSCIALVVSDPSKGVIANDVNVYGVELSSPPAYGKLTCNVLAGSPVAGICANGTFTYTPNPGSSGVDSFGYCANGSAAGSATLCTTVSLAASALGGSPTAITQAYTSRMASYLKIDSPGLLVGNTDPNGLPLNVVVPSSSPAVTLGGGASGAGSVVLDTNGGFVLSIPGNMTAGTASFSYTVQDSQGRTATGTVNVTLPQPSNLTVKVVDAQAYNNCSLVSSCITALPAITDYRWIIEEDQTFWVDPNCTTNSSVNTPGCPSLVGPAGQTTIPVFGVQFHTSHMPYIAQGCTGPLSCEGGQMMLDTRPACTGGAGVPAGCSTTSGQHIPAVCDVGNGACRPDLTGNGYTPVDPKEVALDPSKRYYISVLPGDAGNPFPAYLGQPACDTTQAAGTPTCGHTMSGSPIHPACNILGGPNACPTVAGAAAPAFSAVTVLALPTPLPTGKLSLIVFEDDYPLNGEQDGGGGNGVVAPIEPGLGGFNIVLWDNFGGLGDATGQDTYDAFNEPLSNSLAGTVDPATGLDACPVTESQALAPVPVNTGAGPGAPQTNGVTGTIVTCPKYESDGTTLSPLAGQAVIQNLMPDKFSVQAYPGADRIARGEEWLQTNTLDGQHPHDSFIRIGEPSYFQEYGPAGYHVAIGFANPAIINARAGDVCAGAGSAGAVGPCNNTIDGQVDVQRLSRTPDQRLYPSGTRDALAWTQCWVSLGDPDGEDFMFTKCDAQGNFKFSNVPGGNWRLTIGDQWNDQIIDGLSTPANVGCVPTSANNCSGAAGAALHMGNIGVQQWQANLYTRIFIDDNKNGIWDQGEIGIPFLYTRIYYRDGSNANGQNTDFNGVANFNETFPLFNWYVVEADSTRYKTTGIHTVYDAGGPSDGSPFCAPPATRNCGTSTAYTYMTNTFEGVPLPKDLSVPGAVYCAKADCTAEATSFAAGTAIPSGPTASTGRIDPPWVNSEGWSGLTTQSNWIDFGKAPYAACNNPTQPASSTNFCTTVTFTPPGAKSATSYEVGENGGIHGQITYASTRPFDNADQMILQPWEPLVPGVTLNLYQEGVAADGVTPTLTLVDTTVSSSWDAWAQGFYPNSAAGSGSGAGQKPYMSCPGQGTSANGAPNQDLFFFTLFDQPNYLDWYNAIHSTPATAPHVLPYNSQYKCYDSMHIGNQIQPAWHDGEFFFPSVLGIDPTTGVQITPSGVTAGVNIGTTNQVLATMTGTNCTICVANPDSTDKYRYGTPMLPPGKYQVQIVMPPGYEVYKEEDKNLLIGDNFIAPVAQEFAGLGGDIFIIPDQASVASMYDETASGYNPNNFQDETTALGLGDELSGVPGYPGFQDPVWPCVGEMRVVPDFLSLFPHAQEVAPFAGATRPLCDRKEVTLGNQMNIRMHFAIYTSTHIASKFSGGITDDYTSEFDPFAPQFGEKFAPPNLPISTRDYLGNEISRVYSDHWGTYDGLTFSSWEVNPPNITGYSPTMMVQCMNDPGPIVDTNPTIPNPNGNGTIANPTYGQLITDPLYNSAYSDFCYEQPFMPGLTNYTDTPVVPTQAFVGAGYNNVDCSYPDTTPAIKEVDGDGIGPWLSAAGPMQLTITALGDTQVPNSAYSGPAATAAPFNMKTVTRHYGFGPQGTVTVGGVPLAGVGWSETTITGTVQLSAGVGGPSIPLCPVQQQSQYSGGAGPAYCGELVITSGNGRQSIDTVTITIGGKQPHHVDASASVQTAIDTANPGDLLMIDPTCTATSAGITQVLASCTAGGYTATTPASHQEMLLMWKPVRLQGVGAATSIINANAQPAGKLLDPWRRHVNCLFGLTLTGVPLGQGIPQAGGGVIPAVYDPTGTYNCPEGNWSNWIGTTNVPQVDRLPLEAVVGWDATVNGNLAEQLQEPSLMGAYEGAGITVLGKGVSVPAGQSPWTDGSEPGAFPIGTLLLQNVPASLPAVPQQNDYCTNPATGLELKPNPYPSNYMCNPSSIDGLSITNSSQGGGGVFVHGWAHNLQVANNRIFNNAGTLSGGVNIGQGEFPVAITVTSVSGGVGQQSVLDAPPSCENSNIVGTHLPYCLNRNVNVHNNDISANSSLGDELFSGTLAGGGAASFCTGADYYKFQYNWVCGNQSSAEGGGISHMGFIYHGDIEHNSIVLNQSTNPTIPTNGGGIIVMGTPDTDPICGTQIDADCPPGLSDGTGPGLIINANLIQGNMAESGSGGGIRLQQVNGTEVSTFPLEPLLWNSANLTNNIIVNNLAGWDGAGISLEDSLNVAIVNNTIARNDTLASSGVLTQSIGTPQASAPAGNCFQPGPTGPTSASCPQSSGLTSMQNTPPFIASLTGLAATLRCPFVGANNHLCAGFSNPAILNDLIYHNRAFYIGVGNQGQGNLNQQALVSLFTMSGAPAPNQASTGACSSSDRFWDVGVRGDSGPGNHNSGFTLNPQHTLLSTGGGGGANPRFISEYCNGSRVPPECTAADGCGGPSGFGVPPGIVDASTPNPLFSLTPSATVDEGNNWINVSFGPLDLSNPSIQGTDGNWGGGLPLGNYGLDPNSGAIDRIATSETVPPGVTVPATDYYGNPRPNPDGDGMIDYGAIETQTNAVVTNATLSSVSPSSGYRGSIVNVTFTGTNLSGTSSVNISGGGIAVSGIANVSATEAIATFTISATASLTARNISLTTSVGTTNTLLGAFTVLQPTPTLTSIVPNSGTSGSSVVVTLNGTFLAGATVNVTQPAAGTPNRVTVTGVSVNAAGTQLTATFNLFNGAGFAPVGARNVTVTTGGITSAPALTFTVLAPPPPTLTSIVPNTGTSGSSVAVTLTGTNLGGATVNVTQPAAGTPNRVTVTGVSVNAAGTQLTATFNLFNGGGFAPVGARNVTVTTAGGTSAPAVTFTVLAPPAPTLASITPNSGTNGTSVNVTLTGTNFTNGTIINVTQPVAGAPNRVTVSGVSVNAAGTQITATFHLFTGGGSAPAGPRNVNVTTAGGTSTPAITFTVN